MAMSPLAVRRRGTRKRIGDINQQSITEIWNGKAMRNFRSKLLRGKPDERCTACYDKESSGFRSLRQVTNADYAHLQERLSQTRRNGALPEADPVYLDIRFSNVCNLKCRICGPWSSSQWHNDAVAFQMKSPDQKAIQK